MSLVKGLGYFVKDQKRSKFASIIEKATEMGAYTMDTETYTQHVLRLVQQHCFSKKMRNDAILLHAIVEMRHIMPKLAKPDGDASTYYEDIGCGVYSGDRGALRHRYEYLNQNIVLAMVERRIIFVTFDIEDYGVEVADNKNEYVGHSTCAVFVPRTLNSGQNEYDWYDCYYINSHGQDMNRQCEFDVIVSNRRLRTYPFSESIDVVFMKGYIKYLHQYSKAYTGKVTPITYDGSPEHTYLGTDLQAGDGHGVCFAYPLILWYYFGRYFASTRTIVTRTGHKVLSKGSTMLKNGHLGEFVELCFSDFCPSYELPQVGYKGKTYERAKAVDDFQTVIEKQNTLFIKRASGALISFLAQSFFKNIIES